MNVVARLTNYRPCYTVLHRSSASSSPLEKTTESYDAKKIILQQLNPKVNIPTAKQWSTTAVLEALSSTVGSEVTQNFEELQSPAFWNEGRRPFEQKHLLRHSGRAAANYVIHEYNNLFQHDFECGDIAPWVDVDDDLTPVIAETHDDDRTPESQDFHRRDTRQSYEERLDLDDSVESFQKLIELKKIQQAVTMFSDLQKKNVDIPEESLNQFVGLLAFYKGSDEIKTLIEELPSRAYSYRCSYNENGELDCISSVFEKLPSDKPELIQAQIMALGNQTKQCCEKVVSLYEERVEGKFKASIDVYNQVLLCLFNFHPSNRYRTAKRVIHELNEQKMAPNYTTFCLFMRILPLHNMPAQKLLRRFSALLADMNTCGIECGPEVFASMVVTAHRHTVDDRDIIIDTIFDYMSDKNLKYHNGFDHTSYSRILVLCDSNLNRMKKLMDIVQYGNNNLPMSYCYRSSYSFYNNFFKYLMKSDSVETVFYYYQKLVPARVHLTTKTRRDFILFAGEHKRPEYLPILYAGFSEGRSYADDLNVLLHTALNTLSYADEDTKTQLKHLAMIEIKFCTKIISSPMWDKLMNICFEIVLLSSNDVVDVMTCFNRFLSLRNVPSLEDKLLKKLEVLGKEHKSNAVHLALEQFKKMLKKSPRRRIGMKSKSKPNRKPEADNSDNGPLVSKGQE